MTEQMDYHLAEAVAFAVSAHLIWPRNSAGDSGLYSATTADADISESLSL
jgi:hypothetical protein